METTIELLERVKEGDRAALEHLVERSVPPLKRWARGRLPQHARSLQETQDLVQNAVLRAIPRLNTFEARNPGALQAFLRQAVANEIIDEIRKVKRRPEAVPIVAELPATGSEPARTGNRAGRVRALRDGAGPAEAGGPGSDHRPDGAATEL